MENNAAPGAESAALDFPDLAGVELDVEEVPIDDNEFHIPSVSEPSLDSILNDLGEISASDDEGGPANDVVYGTANIKEIPETSDTVSIVSRGSSDSRSRTSIRSYRQKVQNASIKKPNSMLRHVLLKEITGQLNSAADKVNSGTPTALAIGNLVAVGTSHGFVLVFDSMQVLKWCFGDQVYRDEGGAVSSLAISHNGTRLLAGFAKGLILMYDLENGKLLRTLYDVHAPGTAVLVLRFTDYPILALCSDSGGSVFELNFKRTLGIRGCDSRCIFTGSRGEVCIFEPLLIANYPDNPLNKFVIVALATLSKVIVVMIRPKLKVLFMHPLASDPSTLPLIQWQMVIIQTVENAKVVDPVLTFARDNTVYFYQVSVKPKTGVQFYALQKISLNYQMLSMQWLNSRTLAFVDTKEKLRIIDVRSQDEIETIDLSQARLVYASSQFKGLATGGNVSRAFALAGEKACYNSISCLSNQIIVLGIKSVHALTMRSWHERLDYLMRQHHYSEALQLGYQLYLEKAKAVVGLKGSKDSKKMIVREKLIHLLDQFIQQLPKLCNSEDSNSFQAYLPNVSTCINYLVLLEHVSPITETLYDVCCQNHALKSAYLEALEPFILNDKLRSLSPLIVQEFVAHYASCGKFKPLEACIVHLNVECLDIHQTMKLCWAHGMHDAIIYIYNRGMLDYMSPIEELVATLQKSIYKDEAMSDTLITLGNRLLVYISCCLVGRAYPYGEIPENMMGKVQSDVFSCITSLHSRNADDSERAYPYIRTFLKFDTREFLNVLSLSFEEFSFDSELGRRLKQRMVDILLQVMVEDGDFNVKQVGMLFTFLARQMAKVGNTLFVSNRLFEQVLEHLTSPEESSSVEERQQALLELLQAGGLQHLEHENLLEKCYKAKFYRICEKLHEERAEYLPILECYLNDIPRRALVFNFIHKVLCILPDDVGFINHVIGKIQILASIDSKKTARVTQLHLMQYLSRIVEIMAPAEDELFALLSALFDSGEPPVIEASICEKYLLLLCRKQPFSVISFLKSIDANKLNGALALCQKYENTIATCYLLELSDRHEEAYQRLSDRLSYLLQTPVKYADETSPTRVGELSLIFETLLDFCKRNSSNADAQDKQQMWVRFMELLMRSPSMGKNTNELSTHDMTKIVMTSMMGHVPLQKIVEIVMNAPSHQKATFAEISDLVTNMLEACVDQTLVMTLVKQIAETSVCENLKLKCKRLKKGISLRSHSCTVCGFNFNARKILEKEVLSVVVFQCGHIYHESCLQTADSATCLACISINSSSHNLIIENSTWPLRDTEMDRSDHIATHAEFELQLHAPVQVANLSDEF